MEKTVEELVQLMKPNSFDRGNCSICGIKGQSKKDFLCEDCVDLNGALIFCEKCGRTFHIYDADDQLWLFLRQLPDFTKIEKIDDLKGLSIKISWCLQCQTENSSISPLRVLVYRARL